MDGTGPHRETDPRSSRWQAGALWNTRAFVAKASTVWEIGWKTMPHFMPYFERLGQAIGCPNESLELETIYKKASAVDFSDIQP